MQGTLQVTGHVSDIFNMISRYSVPDTSESCMLEHPRHNTNVSLS